MNKVRIVWVDYVKVICIFLMIACHVDQKFINPTWIYQFHMPAFFIVSGLLFKARPIKKEILSFAVPVVFCSIINVGFNVMCLIMSHSFVITPPHEYFAKWVESLWRYRDGEIFPGIWFIGCLLAMRILFSSNWCRKRAYTIAFVCCMWMMVSQYIINDNAVSQFHLYHVFAALPFFVAGIWAKEHPDIFGRAIKCPFEIKMSLFVVFLFICSFQGFCAIAENEFGLNYFFYMLNALIGSFLLICACQHLPERRYIVNLSCGTFLLLGLHRTLSACNVIVLFQPLGLEGTYVPFLNTALILLWCYLPICFLRKRCPLLLGK